MTSIEDRQRRAQRAEQAIRRGSVTLAFDTNCIIGRTSDGKLTFPFNTLADAVENLRMASEPHHLEIVIPAPVHFEVLHDLRIFLREAHRAFDEDLIIQSLKNRNVRVEPFDAEVALDASAQLFRWYPGEAEWQEAKNTSRGATIDWLIATQAEARRWVLVADDKKGGEYAKVTLAIGRARLRDVLKDLCKRCGAESPWGS